MLPTGRKSGWGSRLRRGGIALGSITLLLSSTSAGAGACEPLTTGERAAQAVMTRVPGTELNAKNRRLVARRAGSVLISGYNMRSRDQTERFAEGLHRKAPLRLLTAVNEEQLETEGFVQVVPARELARKHGSDFARRQGREIGEAMRELGLDWNLSPVLDVASADSYIAERAYSGDAARVARYGTAYAEGLRAGGVETSGKHFPGHGRTDVDSHERMPIIDAPLQALIEEDMAPYVEARDALTSVMTSHILYTAIDPWAPASLSRAVTDLLRDEVGFRGVLITDGLHMGSIRAHWSIPDAAKHALVAGADIALTSEADEADAVHDKLVAAVRSGELPAARLDQAVGRVLKMKGYSSTERDCLLG